VIFIVPPRKPLADEFLPAIGKNIKVISKPYRNPLMCVPGHILLETTGVWCKKRESSNEPFHL
jgi:hypothetical protein